MMRKRSSFLPLGCALAALLIGSGCAARNAHLQPAASANAVAPSLAVTRQSGLAVRAQADHWNGVPKNLADQYTPMKVTLRNNGNKPVAVRYSEFVLTEKDGTEFHAIPPIKAKGAVYEQAARPYAYPYAGFMWAPWYTGWYPGIAFWGGPFDWDDGYYNTYYPQWKVKLPTADMIHQALPEGVLKPGGSITGYLYFQKVPRNAKQVELQVNLHAPGHGPQVAQLEIPFVVK